MKNNYSSPRYSIQYSKSYIVYMIVGSYFHDSICCNEMEEKHLYLHYKEMPNNKQLREEKSLIDFFERHYRDLIKEIADMRCNVSFRKTDGNYYICFDTGIGRITAVIAPDGEYDILAC